MIDARWDTVGSKVKKILNLLIGGGGGSSSSSGEGGNGSSPPKGHKDQCGEISGVRWDATVDSGKGQLPLCDPALSLLPVRIRKVGEGTKLMITREMAVTKRFNILHKGVNRSIVRKSFLNPNFRLPSICNSLSPTPGSLQKCIFIGSYCSCWDDVEGDAHPSKGFPQ